METKTIKRGDVVTIEGYDWTVVNTGAIEGENVYVHLISKTRGQQHKNGFCGLQSAGWLGADGLLRNRPK